MKTRDAATEVVQVLQQKGFQAVFAGGCVRDKLMGLKPHDFDIASSATPDKVEATFPNTIPVGKAFGVVRVQHKGFEFEVATFRRDSTDSDGRRPNSVEFSSMIEDAKRRDLTINAVFEDPISGEIHDFVGGVQDIQAKAIRFVGNAKDRIEEDALRILRAIRFSQKFGWDTSITDVEAVKTAINAGALLRLSAERVRDELTKILSSAKDRGAAMHILLNFGVWAALVPEVAAMARQDQSPPWHREGSVVQDVAHNEPATAFDPANEDHKDASKFEVVQNGSVFDHVALVVANLSRDASPGLLWAGVLHDIAKPATAQLKDKPDGKRWTFNGHEVEGVPMAEAILRKLKFSVDDIKAVCRLVRSHMELHRVFILKKHNLWKLVARDDFEDLVALGIADNWGSQSDTPRDFSWVTDLRNAREELGPLPAPLVAGEDLIAAGFKPGPAFKTALAQCFDKQLELGWDREKLMKAVKGFVMTAEAKMALKSLET